MLPTKFPFIWPIGFRGEYFFISANQKQELPVVAMFVNCYFVIIIVFEIKGGISKCELLLSLGVRHPLTFHILFYSS
jgi:hypothetical protein